MTGDGVGLSQVLRGKVTRRVVLALTPFSPQIRKVTVRLAELVSPLGGVDRRCRMRAWLKGGGDVRSAAIDESFDAAAATAAATLAQRAASRPKRSATGASRAARRRLATRSPRRART